MANNFYKNLFIELITNQKIFIIIFSSTLLVAFLLNIFQITYPKDGVHYIYLAKSLLSNMGDISNIRTMTIGDKIHTPQFGSIIILTTFYFLSPKFYLFLFIFTVLILNIFSINILFKNYKLFFDNKLVFIFFLIVTYFQFNLLRTSSSFFNEAIYYPLFVISIVNFFLFLDNKNIQNPKMVSIFFCFGIFFQLQHLVILSSMLITIILSKFKIKNSLNKKNFKTFVLISIISSLLFILTIALLMRQGIYESNFSGVTLYLNRILQIFLSPFVSALNLHLILINYMFVWSPSNDVNIFYILVPVLIAFTCILSLVKIEKKIFIFIITFFIILFFTKILLFDFDIRYNIYINFFIGYLFILYLTKFKKYLIKIFIIFSFSVSILFGYFVYNYLTVNKLLSELNNYKDIKVYENKRWDSKYYRFLSRPTYQKINFLKKINSENNVNDIDYIVTNENSRLIYWILKKEICKIESYMSGVCPKSNKIIFLLSDSDKKNPIDNYETDLKIYIYPNKM